MWHKSNYGTITQMFTLWDNAVFITTTQIIVHAWQNTHINEYVDLENIY